jgi:hypothetical protein
MRFGCAGVKGSVQTVKRAQVADTRSHPKEPGNGGNPFVQAPGS